MTHYRVILACLLLGGSSALLSAAEEAIDFTRDVRPILAANCFHCHGQDPSHREADLRLDVFQSPSEELSGAETVITPKKPDESELVARITSDDPDVHMPPPDSGKTLKSEEIETLRKWIEQGAEYKPHWAFVPPQRPAMPPVSDAAWVKNPIDAFVLARLEQEGLRPSAPAAPNTLLRRLSLDLVGLPPTVEEVAAFEKEIAIAKPPLGRELGAERQAVEGAYLAAIDKLLASPHFGEKWARWWLDAARYSDSDGFEKDKPRFVWMYRDWVIDALNADKPYDQFIIEQIAGDLLPNAGQDQRVATGFLRNSMLNEEGGIDPEQFRMEAMYDRMDAIGKAVLGLTVQCAQCHTHKYDPIEQTDYYRMFAFLNNCDEGQLTTYTDAEQSQWAATQELISRFENDLKAENPDWSKQMAAWEETVRNAKGPEWTVVRPHVDATGDQKHYLLEDGSVLNQGYAPCLHQEDFEVEVKAPGKITAVRLELLNDPNLPHGGPGRSIYGLFGLTEFKVSAGPLDKKEKLTPLKIAKVTADVSPAERLLDAAFDDKSGRRRVTGPIEYTIDGKDETAWDANIGAGRSNVPHNAVFVLEKPLEVGAGQRISFGVLQNHGGWNSDDNQNNNLGRFRFSVTDAEKAEADPLPAAVRAILAIPEKDRTPAQVDAVFGYWRTTVAEWAEANRRLEALLQSHPQGTTQLVLSERQSPRKTHRLERGDFLKPAEEVTPGVPAFLHPLAGDSPNRSSFARWLVDRRSPTTARAIVNRIWQSYFGAGLVTTPEDLGTQGALPTHPELLDWLAVELMDSGWSLKHIHRLIVSSATYQQSAAVTPELLARDPMNQWLARGPRFRVDAETVRDIALAVSGLLTDKLGGPSVYPPAPEFLFQPPTSYGPKSWYYDTGPDKYRRALYTFRFRSVPYPALESFDAPRGDAACVRRTRSNTPLQALTTLNESLSMECARALAKRAVTEGGSDDQARLTFVVRRCLSRDPHSEELAALQDFLNRQKERFHAEGADPWPLIADQKPADGKLTVDANPADVAAWTALARVVLNLDETITKE
jgi:mono/diheme cytochrome c family protein